MPTTSIRQTHAVTDSYTDVTTSITGVAGVGGFLCNYGDQMLEVVKGGAQPAASVRGKPLQPYGDEWAEATTIWVRCRAAGAKAVVGFETVS